MRPLLYALTATKPDTTDARLVADVAAAVHGGIDWLQYRDKSAAQATRRRRAEILKALCAEAGVRFLINDDWRLAAAVGADGVHLGREDGLIAEARATLGREALIGASCGDSLERARRAIAEGASYVAFGRLYPSRTKPEAPPVSLERVAEAVRDLPAPVCAIGGIRPEHLPEVLDTGVKLVAVVDGVFGAPDVEAAVRRYRAGLDTYNR